MALNGRALGAGALVLAAGLAVAGVAQAGGAGPPDAEAAYAHGRYEQARRIWQDRAEAGDAAAQFSLGLLYDLGQGVKRDPAQAYHWYLRAAEAGLPAASFNVAAMLYNGAGVAADRGEAALWFARAAAAGHARAQFNLARQYADGDGVPRNADIARAWYEAAATTLPAAAAALGKLPEPRREAATTPARAVPLAPLGETRPTRFGNVGAGSVALVWLANPQPAPARYFIELLALRPEGNREVFAGFVDRSAVAAPVPHGAGSYAWRVYTVAPSLARYAASDWARFEVD